MQVGFRRPAPGARCRQWAARSPCARPARRTGRGRGRLRHGLQPPLLAAARPRNEVLALLDRLEDRIPDAHGRRACPQVDRGGNAPRGRGRGALGSAAARIHAAPGSRRPGGCPGARRNTVRSPRSSPCTRDHRAGETMWRASATGRAKATPSLAPSSFDVLIPSSRPSPSSSAAGAAHAERRVVLDHAVADGRDDACGQRPHVLVRVTEREHRLTRARRPSRSGPGRAPWCPRRRAPPRGPGAGIAPNQPRGDHGGAVLLEEAGQPAVHRRVAGPPGPVEHRLDRGGAGDRVVAGEDVAGPVNHQPRRRTRAGAPRGARAAGRPPRAPGRGTAGSAGPAGAGTAGGAGR